MRIRPDQIAAFERLSRTELERNLLAGLRQEFPRLRGAQLEGELIALVRLALEKCARHELTAAHDVQRYLCLMALLGAHWELDPQAAWAAAAFAPREGTSASQRLEALWTQALAWRERVHGPQDVLYLEALGRLTGASIEDLCKSASRSQHELLLQLAQLYPRKFAETGEQTLYEITRLAVEACKPHELLDRWAVVLVAQLMFLLGAGFLGDPLHAWAARALKAGAGQSVDRRLEMLRAAAAEALDAQRAAATAVPPAQTKAR